MQKKSTSINLIIGYFDFAYFLYFMNCLIIKKMEMLIFAVVLTSDKKCKNNDENINASVKMRRVLYIK